MTDSRSGSRPSHFFDGQELPGPVDRFLLEVIAEREVAEHLEERVVIRRDADVADVAGAQALLAGGGRGELERADAEELVLELVHSGGREQHGLVPARDEDVARPADAAFGLERTARYFSRSSSVFIGRVKQRTRERRKTQ